MAMKVSKSRIAIAVLLLLALTTPLQAAAPKAGAKCTKIGSTATSGGKKFTCIKSGTKLVWNKGVAIKAAAPKPSATPTPETKPEVKNLLATDPRITPTSALTALDTCKTEDMTPDYRDMDLLLHKNGFPRPTKSVIGKSTAKILVIPMSFEDLPFRAEKQQIGQLFTSDIDILNDAIPRVRDSFKQLSAGRFDIQIDVLPQSEWWILKRNNPLSGLWGIDNFPKIAEIIEQEKSTFKFTEYDTYVFVTGNGTVGQQGLGSAQAMFGEENQAKAGKFGAVLMAGGYTNPTLWVHELGHSLFAFEDLYLFNENSETPRSVEYEVPLKWDLMANSNRGSFIEWNKFLMGWLFDSEIRCLTDQKSSVHYLSTVDTSKDSKLLTINLSPGVTLGAESRISTSDSSGLLLYTVNTHISHGQGPILAQKSLVLKGQSKSWQGWQFNVLDSDADGILFEAIKTDIDKFVPPAPKPKPNNQQPPPTSKIQVTRGEILPNGFLKGRATWDVKGHKSYRLYVTATDDFQKVFFESGFVNDDRSPIVVDISGLVCNRELRTITEFYTEKDGKGERFVVENKQLSFLSCEDTTKKP